MLFNSYTYLFCFLPLVLMVFGWLGRRYGGAAPRIWLIVASAAFYGYWRGDYLFLLAASIVFNYVAGLAIAKASRIRRAGLLLLTIAITGNLALLGYYKYADFIIANVNSLAGATLPLQNLVLPLAISFFTFNQIAFLVDVHRGYVHDYGFVDYALFIVFFPHLIAGPIVHHRDIIPQFRSLNFSLSSPLVSAGLAAFSIGLFKKVILADHLAPYANALFDHLAPAQAPTFAEAWLGMLAYSLQLYYDFSGYSEMAVGAALLFGVRFPWNFASPYKADSIIAFWRRWHITLSEFLRDYLYFPLGGSRKGPTRRNINILITMLLGGLWHGANWTFVLWGGLHGLFLAINHGWRDWRASRAAVNPSQLIIERLLGHCLTLSVVTLAWVLFRADSLSSAVTIYHALFTFSPGMDWTLDPRGLFPHFSSELQPTAAALGIAMLLVACMGLPNVAELTRPLLEAESEPRQMGLIVLNRTCAIATGSMAWIAVLFLARPTEFLYYQF